MSPVLEASIANSASFRRLHLPLAEEDEEAHGEEEKTTEKQEGNGADEAQGVEVVAGSNNNGGGRKSSASGHMSMPGGTAFAWSGSLVSPTPSGREVSPMGSGRDDDDGLTTTAARKSEFGRASADVADVLLQTDSKSGDQLAVGVNITAHQEAADTCSHDTATLVGEEAVTLLEAPSLLEALPPLQQQQQVCVCVMNLFTCLLDHRNLLSTSTPTQYMIGGM
jgi:hypothetical protein